MHLYIYMYIWIENKVNITKISKINIQKTIIKNKTKQNP